jgi:hypothetical protein
MQLHCFSLVVVKEFQKLLTLTNTFQSEDREHSTRHCSLPLLLYASLWATLSYKMLLQMRCGYPRSEGAYDGWSACFFGFPLITLSGHISISPHFIKHEGSLRKVFLSSLVINRHMTVYVLPWLPSASPLGGQCHLKCWRQKKRAQTARTGQPTRVLASSVAR